MNTAKINVKNMDYFKYRKLVIDGSRDDYSACSREIKSLCDAVQTLSFRDDEFDDATDRARFDDVCSCYRQILAGKRIDPLDMRLKSGWWGDPGRTGSGYSAGKIKSGALMEVLSYKTRDWASRHHQTSLQGSDNPLDGRGLYVLKHRERQCFQVVGRADNVFVRCSELLKAAFDGTSSDPLSALIVISLAADWDFYFVPVETSDGDRLERILENDLILKHDSIWPHGLNFSLHLDSLVEVTEFRRSCLRHRWPPDYDTTTRNEPQLDLDVIRRQLAICPASDRPETGPDGLPANGGSASTKKNTSVHSDSRDASITQRVSPATVGKVAQQTLHLSTLTKAAKREVTGDEALSKTGPPSQADGSARRCVTVATTSKSTSKLTSKQKPAASSRPTTTTRSRSAVGRSHGQTSDDKLTTSGQLMSTLAANSSGADDSDETKTLQRSSTYTCLLVSDSQAQLVFPSD